MKSNKNMPQQHSKSEKGGTEQHHVPNPDNYKGSCEERVMMTSGISQEDIIMTSLYVTPVHPNATTVEDHIATKNGTINATPNK